MIGKQDVNTSMFQLVTMEDLVPPDHLLRRLHAVLDLKPVLAKVVDRYSKVGRRSFDPEVVARIWILQYMYGMTERQVCDEMRMHAGFRWFCHLSFNDPVPDQSTLVKLRNDKWAGTDFHEELLRQTVRACEAAGICRPDRMGVDGTQITANAATVSLEEISPELTIKSKPPRAEPADSRRSQGATQPPEPCEPPAFTVEEGGRPHHKHKSGDPDWHGEKFSNSTHRSTTDPDARLYKKGQQCEAKLRYLGHYLADITSGVIYSAMATEANGYAEREAACALLDSLPQKPGELVADLGYRDTGFLVEIRDRGITPIVPLKDEDEEIPTYKRRTRDLRKQCERIRAQEGARARNEVRSIAKSRRGVKAQRQRTRIEHLYAEAKDNHGLGRARFRGIAKVDAQVKLTAAVQNLKRLMRGRPRKGVSVSLCMQPSALHGAFPRLGHVMGEPAGAPKRRSATKPLTIPWPVISSP